MRLDTRDFLPLLDANVPVDDELRRADVDVVAAAALEVLHEHACAVGPAVGAEAGCAQAGQEIGVAVGDFGRDVLVQALEDGVGQAHEEEVGVVGGRAGLGVEGADHEVDAGFGGDDVRAAALYHGHGVAVLVEVLRDVVPAVAAADDEGVLAGAVGAGAGELGGVDEAVAAKGVEAFDVRGEVLLAGVAGGLDDVARVEFTCVLY